jgi:uncharacterized protein
MKPIPQDNALLLHVKVVPNSSRTQIAGILGDALKIKVAQPPEAGRANRAVIDLLAQSLALPPAQISIVAGHAQPRKTVRIHGLSAAALERWLNTQ